MDTLMLFLLGLCAGLVIGWFLLPAPKLVQDFWVRMGWAEKPPEAIVPEPEPVPAPVASVSKTKAKRKK